MTLVEAKKLFLNFLKSNERKRFVIATHTHADIDTLVSAYALTSVFSNSVLAVPDDLNESATALANELKIKFDVIRNLDKSKFDGMIVADTGAYSMLKDARNWKIILIVDHHRSEGRDMQADNYIIKEESPSCAELVANILPNIKDKKIAFALSCGIVSDTARFKNGGKETFDTLAKLLHIADVSYQDILYFAEPELDSATKIAILKAFQRLNYQIIGKYVVVTSEVASSEGSASAAISDVADVVFVANYKEQENECRISARARKQVTVPLHEVMKEVASRFGGSGGGHSKAAGVYIPKMQPKDALKVCIDIFSMKMKS